MQEPDYEEIANSINPDWPETIELVGALRIAVLLKKSAEVCNEMLGKILMSKDKTIDSMATTINRLVEEKAMLLNSIRELEEQLPARPRKERPRQIKSGPRPMKE